MLQANGDASRAAQAKAKNWHAWPHGAWSKQMNSTILRLRFAFRVSLFFGAAVAAFAAQPAMRSYRIDLPHHILHFALPEEIAKGMTPYEVDKQFDPFDASYFRNGFREIAGTDYEFKGPFWVGTIGSLKFHFMVQMRLPAYKDEIRTIGGLEDEILTINGLDRYVRWKIGSGERSRGCVIGRSTLNNMPAVRREWNSFGNPSEVQPEHIEIFSLPLDEGMFLDVGFNVREWVKGRAGKWKKKAEAMREAIKATIVLERKPQS